MTQDQRDKLIALWNLGHSASNIADLMGCTRNVVIGHVSRARKRGVVQDEEHAAKHMPRPSGWQQQSAGVKRRATARKGSPTIAPIPAGKRQPIPDFPARHRCVFPYGDPGARDFRWCGEHALYGPYCDVHRARCWQVRA